MQNKFKSRRYKITARKDHLELEPLQDVEDLYLSFANKIKSDWEKLEEKGEDFVLKGRRSSNLQIRRVRIAFPS
jgi:hypothetical protein